MKVRPNRMSDLHWSMLHEAVLLFNDGYAFIPDSPETVVELDRLVASGLLVRETDDDGDIVYFATQATANALTNEARLRVADGDKGIQLIPERMPS